jgi:hypothetical protein
MFWINCHRTKIKAYSDRKKSTLSEYAFIFVLSCMIQKLCVEKSGYSLSRSYGIWKFENESIFNNYLDRTKLFTKVFKLDIKHLVLYDVAIFDYKLRFIKIGSLF